MGSDDVPGSTVCAEACGNPDAPAAAAGALPLLLAACAVPVSAVRADPKVMHVSSLSTIPIDVAVNSIVAVQ